MKVRLFEFLVPFYSEEQEPLRIRTFAPKGYPKGKGNPAPKPFGDIFSREYTVTRAVLRDDRELQERIKSENHLSGIYFVVNAGISEAKQLPPGVCARKSKESEKPEWTQYVEDSDIVRFNSFFVESDNKSIEDQLAQIERCPLWPSIWNITLKSVHSYWPRVSDITLEEWTDIQLRLIAYFGSDGSIKNPSRVMRLPNLNHVKYDRETETMSYKRIEITRFDADRRFTVEEMRAAFPAIEGKQKIDWQSAPAGSGEYKTWEELGNELRRRMAAHRTAHRQGDKVVLQGVCHNGKGNSALFFNITTGKYHCDAGCKKEDILRAFSLPERPTGKLELKLKGSLTPYAALALRINPESWGGNSDIDDFFARCPTIAGNSLIEKRVGPPAAIVGDSAVECSMGVCADCDMSGELYGEWCFECSELRKFLNDGPNALTCNCTGANRWRFRGGGFRWYCGNCERDRAPLDAVWSL